MFQLLTVELLSVFQILLNFQI